MTARKWALSTVVDGMADAAKMMMDPPPGKEHLPDNVLEQLVQHAFKAGWELRSNLYEGVGMPKVELNRETAHPHFTYQHTSEPYPSSAKP